MDSLLNAFDTSIRVSFDQFDTFNQHPRFASYKEKYTKSRQTERRKEFLIQQKQKKVTSINLKRGLTEKDNVDEIEKELIRNTKKDAKKNDREYKDALMLSEWLVDVPEDLQESWIVVPCPVGKRVLVVAEKGHTVGYNRKGYTVISKFPSGLPGGNHTRRNGYTRLDCIWDERSKILYILDILDFGPNLVNCEAEFRFSWMDWKFEELKDDVLVESRHNRFRIIPLERFPMSQLVEYTSKPIAMDSKMDGLVFFHKEGLYEEYGRSPLVTWLKPYMLTDILNVPTHPDYIADKPQQMELEATEEKPEDHRIDQD